MSELAQLRDHARKVVASGHSPSCRVARPRWMTRWQSPDPACGGCLPEAERDLWLQISREIDVYLSGEMPVDPAPVDVGVAYRAVAEDLFGQPAVEPELPEVPC